MNRCLWTLTVVTLVSIGALSAAESTDRLVVHFFGSSTCGECMEIKEEVLKPLAREHSQRLELKLHDTDTKEGFDLLVAMEERYSVPAGAAQELFFADTFLIGYDRIMDHGEKLILHYLDHPEKWRATGAADADTGRANAASHRRRYLRDRLTFLYVTGGGLADGVNPCAIATMVFFISVLAMQKRKRSEILIIGLSFTFTVYVTYLMLGLGLLGAVTSLKQFRIISEVIRWGTVVFAGTIAVVSFRDAFAFHRSGKTSDIKLQLPKPVKMRIHRVISGNIGKGSLVGGAIVTGFLVTLFEAVCTGQVYIPIIAALSEPGFRLEGTLYLIYYNFLFVLPLLIVMVLAYYGLKWNELAQTTQKHLPLLKILLGTVLAALAVYMGVWG
jgi:cytochrome c biogenesis protein CcdA